MSLKSQNQIALVSVIAVNAAIFAGIVRGEALLAGPWSTAWSQVSALWPAGLASLLVGILNSQLSADAKSRIIFMRWNDPLPGSRAFSHVMLNDHRIDAEVIRRTHGPLPTKPKEQNTLWYRIYRTVSADPSVQIVHQEFLFARDYACLVLLLAVTLVPFAAAFTSSVRSTVLVAAVFGLQFLLASQAARQRGNRFVSTVLAIESAKET